MWEEKGGVGYVARMWRRALPTKFWWGNLRGETPLGRRIGRRGDNIEIDIQKVG
jgi:hypothetical protein